MTSSTCTSARLRVQHSLYVYSIMRSLRRRSSWSQLAHLTQWIIDRSFFALLTTRHVGFLTELHSDPRKSNRHSSHPHIMIFLINISTYSLCFHIFCSFFQSQARKVNFAVKITAGRRTWCKSRSANYLKLFQRAMCEGVPRARVPWHFGFGGKVERRGPVALE